MKTIALIMAGGHGERLWPKSRDKLPKQFLELQEGEGTFLQQTTRRLKGLIEYEDVYVITCKDYWKLVRLQLPVLPPENIIVEPEGKNTAPAIEYAALTLRKKYNDAIMVVLPSDHAVWEEDKYRSAIDEASRIARENGNIVTLGIRPTSPSDLYGYIHRTDERDGNAYRVDRFVEKPSVNTARKLVQDDSYLWNSGMFVFKLSTLCNAYAKYCPELDKKMHDIVSITGTERQSRIAAKYSELKPISIDYAIMELADNIFVLEADFGWDDVGNWLAMERLNGVDQEGNCIIGDVVKYDTKNCIVSSSEKLIATLGVENLVIIETDDAILIASKDKLGDIKEMKKVLKKTKHDRYL